MAPAAVPGKGSEAPAAAGEGGGDPGQARAGSAGAGVSPTLCRELWGPREAARYRGDPRGRLLRDVPGGAAGGAWRAAQRVLLPQGFPESVSSDYLRYQLWDGLQAVGVGDTGATVTGAAMGWLLRDGVGMVTRISFTWWQGSRLDCEAKQWRLAADVMNDVALVLEMLAPHWPPAGPALLMLATVAKCVVGVAGGATRAALVVHQARRDNVADVAAKDGSQETLVNGLGLLLALLLLPLLDGQPWLTVWAVPLLLGTHFFANLRALGALVLPTLNRPRLRLALRQALRAAAAAGRGGAAAGRGGAAAGRGGATPGGGASAAGGARSSPGGGACARGGVASRGGGVSGPGGGVCAGGGASGGGGGALWVPRPAEVNAEEPLLPGFSTRLTLHLGAPLHRLVQSEAEFKKALECGTENYIIVLRPSQGWVGVGLRSGAPPETPLVAAAHALLLEELLGPPLPPGAPMGAALRPLQARLRRCPPGSVPWGVLSESSRLWGELGPRLLRGLAAAGWDTRRHLLALDQWELEWDKPRPL
ncbi:RUS family member 1 isoform X2 [Caloenas nicobarica]|uniref:RUS family member 1 isoform X2 n=1 Tax=Caloenas nicobarica TaxID=187106 RepID=UPI0032B83847